MVTMSFLRTCGKVLPKRCRLVTSLGATVALLLTLGLAGSAQAASGRTFVNLATGFCLDSNSKGEVYTLGCNGGPYQGWSLGSTAFNGVVTLRDQATGRCLDSNADRKVYTLGCNDGSYQKWTVNNGGFGTRTFRNLATGFCLDSNGGRKVYTLGCNDGSYQKWR
ncbi:putative xylanase [Frankia sp. AiPs1]|uniref:RICIN domain-containing protein n=1 Tax=Frankia sp. AiPa1 TaxID=573492 RepID=UPI00202B2658|nr:RICIN domain-containing protein [Frankia sp. AiPa1]